VKRTPEEQLIWEAYVNEADLSDVHFKGDDSVRDLAKISPEELDDEEFIEDDDEYVPDEGDLVKIDSSVGGGAGEVIELSPSGTHAIIKLVKDQEKSDLEKGDRVSVHVGDLSPAKLKDKDDFIEDDLADDDDVSYESKKPVVEGGMDPHRPKTDASGKASSNYTKYDPKHPDAKKHRKRYEELKKKNPGLGRSLPPPEVEEGCGCPAPDDIVGEPKEEKPKLLPKAKLPGKVKAIIIKSVKKK
tara:strand:- start:2352 stop:3083 length:732 start_codon:yes stop_codon:yes gene_type:complete